MSISIVILTLLCIIKMDTLSNGQCPLFPLSIFFYIMSYDKIYTTTFVGFDFIVIYYTINKM